MSVSSSVGASAREGSKARCNLFGHCGGCSHQDLPYAIQLERKQADLATLLKNIPCSIQPIIPCADPWRYRNKMELAFGRDEEDQLILGLRRRGSFSDVLNMTDCWIMSEAANRICNRTREFFRSKSYPVYAHKTHQGLLRFLILRQSFSQNKMMAILVVADASAIAPEDLVAWRQSLLADVPELDSLYLSEQSEWSDTAFSTKLHHLWGSTELQEQLTVHAKTETRGSSFNISPLAFFQTNTVQAQLLYQQIVDAAALTGTETVLDLYCGTGTIGQILAPQARWVYGIESVAPAIADARRNAQANGLNNLTYIVDKSEAWLKWNADDIEAEVWILDPPRSGLHPKIIAKRLPELEARPSRIIYVSCNPKHLPKDLGLLQQWYDIRSIQPVDMFPHTPHLEVVVGLERK